ncbi:hypothetical protein SAMN05421663_1134 [Terribacillus halophilus]|uniref:Uncharacterized protein n=1 Tax=Terribacillus halophilus TaxID=361279 RepID=A0A1G6VKU0_9BACI|nr:hypothetical protein [Terribacillus halophilus]SDD53476.1 hypothetical protein SAMN05421663_1134 [Terribacillus halophilus]
MRKLLFIGCIFFAVILCSTFIIRTQQPQPVIQHFPIDDTATFTETSTSLKKVDFRRVHWRIESILDREAYLRQDVGLLFENGRLVGVMNKWMHPARSLIQEKTLILQPSKQLDAVSFHFAELHKNEITSSFKLTGIRSYTSDTFELFSFPKNEKETQSRYTAKTATNKTLQRIWTEAKQQLSIPANQYTEIPLTALPHADLSQINGLSENNKRQEIISRLWEGLYRNYIVPIGPAVADGTVNTYVPLLLFDKSGKHLRVLYQDENGQHRELLQYY